MDWNSFLSKFSPKFQIRLPSAKEIVEWAERMIQQTRSMVAKAKHTYYRVTVMNNDTFQEIKAYRLSLMNFYVWTSSMFVGMMLLVSGLIIFTPLKKYVPGYGGDSGLAVYQLADQLESLERKARAQEVYNRQFKKLLVGDVETMDKVPTDFQLIPDSLMEIDASESELALRQQVSAGEAYANTGNDTQSGKSVSFLGKPEVSNFVAPVNGTISLDFSASHKHFGVDIVAPKSTPVKVIAAGVVVLADWTQETGNTICVQHADNFVSFYKHNEKNLKGVGDKVAAGEQIAIIGNTGEQTSGPHLHFELWQNGIPLQPQKFIQF
jgi:murein DD-endopeptidase MepM/ murein hydrolase activator NlpD